mmetsp:Transcript_4880/g.12155  ORF Transcript_4880/g.12155 Transcript_4880/m.12155 type:complete len:252 (+) Transcript_4880:1454-2209(+)
MVQAVTNHHNILKRQSIVVRLKRGHATLEHERARFPHTQYSVFLSTALVYFHERAGHFRERLAILRTSDRHVVRVRDNNWQIAFSTFSRNFFQLVQTSWCWRSVARSHRVNAGGKHNFCLRSFRSTLELETIKRDLPSLCPREVNHARHIFVTSKRPDTFTSRCKRLVRKFTARYDADEIRRQKSHWLEPFPNVLGPLAGVADKDKRSTSLREGSHGVDSTWIRRYTVVENTKLIEEETAVPLLVQLKDTG